MNHKLLRALSSLSLGLLLAGAFPLVGHAQLPTKYSEFTIQTPDHQTGVITIYIKTQGFDGGYWEGDGGAAKILGVTHGNYRRFGVFSGSIDMYLSDRHQVIAVLKGLDRISLEEGDHGTIGIDVKGVLNVDNLTPVPSDYQKLDTGTVWATTASWTCTAAL